MTDKELQAIIHQVVTGDDSTPTRHALADKLLDASPQDRLEFISSICDIVKQQREASRSLSRFIRGISPQSSRTISTKWTISTEHNSTSLDYIRDRVRHDAFLNLADSIQPQHWYAIHFDTQVVNQPTIYPYREPISDHFARINIAPLDGGTVITSRNGQ